MADKTLAPADRRLWRLLIWAMGLSTPMVESLKPRSFAVGFDFAERPGSISHLAIKGAYVFFLLLAIASAARGQRGDGRRETRAYWSLVILLGAMPTISSLISGGTFQFTVIGIAGIYAAAYFLPAPPVEWWLREVRAMLLVVFVYGSLAAAVIFPAWAWDKGYNAESSVAVFSWRLYGTASHANALAPLAVFSWMLGRFPGCRLKGELLHGAAVFLVLLFAQSKTIWAIALILIGLYVLTRVASFGGIRKYLTYFGLGAGTYAFATYLIKYSSLAGRIGDLRYDPQVLSLTGRLIIWVYAFDVWLKNPWFGKGLDAWSFKTAQDNMALLGWAAPHAHNQLLQVLTQSGLVGLAIMAICTLYYFRIVRAAPRGIRIPLWWLTAFFFMDGITEVPLQYGIGGDAVMTWIIFTAVLIIAKTYPVAAGETEIREKKECPDL